LEVGINLGTGSECADGGSALAERSGDLWATDTWAVKVLQGEGERVEASKGILARHNRASGVLRYRDRWVVDGVTGVLIGLERANESVAVWWAGAGDGGIVETFAVSRAVAEGNARRDTEVRDIGSVDVGSLPHNGSGQSDGQSGDKDGGGEELHDVFEEEVVQKKGLIVKGVKECKECIKVVD